MSDIEHIARIEQFIVTTLIERFGEDESRLGPEVTLKQLGIDSLGGVELSLAIKRRYGVRFVAGEIQVDFRVVDIAQVTADKIDALGQVAS
jgi:acyl carrier protein